jgi:tyrosine-protein kinase Etk/Wzc
MENNFGDDLEDSFDIKAFLDKYLRQWKWFVLAVSICLLAAFSYLRYTIPQYRASTTILVKDDRKGGMLSEASAFADMGFGMGGIKSNVDNEIEILKSRSLVESTVRRLNLRTRFFVEGNIVDREIYGNGPIELEVINTEDVPYAKSINVTFTELTPTTFELEAEETSDTTAIILGDKIRFSFDEEIRTACGNLTVRKSEFYDSFFGDDIHSLRIVVSPFDNVVAGYRGGLDISSISKTSSVVQISITDAVVNRAEAFLDNIVQIYNEDAAADKNFISENTSIFIANRLKLITQELDGVEEDVQSFKKSNNLTNIESEAKLFIEGSNEYEKKGVETEIQLNVVSSMLDFMKKSTIVELLPSNIIVGEGDASGLISSYNQLVLDRNRVLKSATLSNPSVIKMDQQIASLKNTVQTSLLRMQSSLNIKKRDLDREEGILNAKIGKIPVQERKFRSIARQQKVKEELYLYLLQKREETAISLAATEPNARVIDTAKAGKVPISPSRSKII